MKRFLLPILVVFAIGAFVMSTAPANASMVLILDDLAIAGIDVIMIDDQPVGAVSDRGFVSNVADTGGVAGSITFNGDIPGSNWTVSITTGVSKPIIGPARMDLKSGILTSGTAAGTINLGLTDTDFALGVAGQPGAIRNSWEGTTDGTVLAQGGIGLNNNLEFERIASVNQGPFGPGAFADTAAAGFVFTGNPFSLTELVQINYTAGDQIFSFDKSLEVLEVVPEPSTMLLLATGLVGLAGLRRKFKS